MNLTNLMMPANLHTWEVREAEALRAKFTTETYEVAGVLCWRANDAVISPSTFKDAYVVCSEVQQWGYSAYLDKALGQYRKAQANHKPSAEEVFEMRAAFGPGKTVVNIITGRCTRT